MVLKEGQTKRDLSLVTIGWTGSLGGLLLWASCYPLDVVKTKLQTDSFENPRYRGIVDCVSKTYEMGGVKGFFKGFGPCMARAVPVNGGVFVIYEVIQRKMERKNVERVEPQLRLSL